MDSLSLDRARLLHAVRSGAAIDDGSSLGDGSPATTETVDGSAPDGDARESDSSVVGPGSCFDFTQGPQSFAAEGNAVQVPQEGFVLTIGPGKSGAIKRSFVATTDIQRTIVTVAASVDIAGETWGNAAYMDMLAQYLGSSTSYAGSPAMELELSAYGLEVNVWNEANTYDRTFTIALPSRPSQEAVFQLDTTWSSGATDLRFGDATPHIASKGSSKKTKDFSVVVGRGVTGTTPTATLRVRSLCVSLQ